MYLFVLFEEELAGICDGLEGHIMEGGRGGGPPGGGGGGGGRVAMALLTRLTRLAVRWWWSKEGSSTWSSDWMADRTGCCRDGGKNRKKCHAHPLPGHTLLPLDVILHLSGS